MRENIGDPEAKVIKWGPKSFGGKHWIVRIRYKTPMGGMDVARMYFQFDAVGKGTCYVQPWTHPFEPSDEGTPNPMRDALKRMAEGPDESGNWKKPASQADR